MENPNIFQRFRGSLIYYIIGKSSLCYIAIMLLLILLTFAYDKFIGFNRFEFILPIVVFLISISIFITVEILFFIFNFIYLIFSPKTIYKLSIWNDIGVLLMFVIAFLAIKLEIANAGLFFLKELLRTTIIKFITLTF